MAHRETVSASWTPAERMALLARVPLFASLSTEQRAVLVERGRMRTASRGEIIFVEGLPAESVYLLAEGQVRVIRETDDGREVILRLVQSGELFGAAGSWGADVYPATTIAVDAATVLQFPSTVFRELIDTSSGFAIAIVREIAQRLRMAEQRIQELQTERVERRIARALLRLAGRSGQRTSEGIEITTPLSRQALADLCGTTLSTASRTISAWDRAGILDSGRERIVIKRAHDLVAIAEDLANQ